MDEMVNVAVFIFSGEMRKRIRTNIVKRAENEISHFVNRRVTSIIPSSKA